MAEERLIDDDKDRKYKIRKNADGEDELVIDDTQTPDDESDIPVFDIPVYLEDDDEAAVLTPEQLAERERIRSEEEAARAEKIKSALEKAELKLEEGDFESALYAVGKVNGIADGNGDYYFLKLKILSRNFTDFQSLSECAETAGGVKEFSSSEQKQALKSLSSVYRNRANEAEKTATALKAENERKKSERRSVFAERKTKAQRNLLIAVLPFLVFVVLAIVFATRLFSAENGTFVVLTIVFSALAAIVFIAVLFTLRKFLEANRNVKLNELDSSTKLGREYLETQKQYEYLKIILDSFENDISR